MVDWCHDGRAHPRREAPEGTGRSRERLGISLIAVGVALFLVRLLMNHVGDAAKSIETVTVVVAGAVTTAGLLLRFSTRSR